MQFNLETYQQQRLMRERRRKDFIRRFEAVKARIGIQQPANYPPSQPSEIKREIHVQRHPSLQDPSTSNQQYEQLVSQNKQLKHKLGGVEKATTEKISAMKSDITNLKNLYSKELQEINQLAEGEKQDRTKRLEELIKQIKQGLAKNKEIAATNKEITSELGNSASTFDGYVEELKTEYEEKLKEFDVILAQSNNKIQKMESELNEDQIVESALQNQQLIGALLESSKQENTTLNMDEANLILLEKNKIIEQLVENSKKRETEVVKIKQLSETYKSVFESLNSEKQVLVTDNRKMTAELLQIRKIFAQVLGEDADQDQEGDDEQEGDEVEQEIEADQAN